MNGQTYFILVVAGITLVLGALIVATAMRIAPEHQRMVVFRLGRLLGVYGPGMFLLMPFVDRAVTVDLRERVRKVEGETITTRDDQAVAVDVTTVYRVVDPAKSVLGVEDLESAMREGGLMVLRSAMAELTHKEWAAGREEAGTQVRTQLQQMAEAWGVEVKSVEIREVR